MLHLLDFFFGIRFRVLNNNYSERVNKRILVKVKNDFKEMKVHPDDLKKSLSLELNKIL